ncbi:unknown; predicted coding region [Mycoplasmopsis pulmonis]|uniref:NERD domain-containing protein n=1 Tax=Mycoplasmopsis pulmonis (strain UAB CTIP) TaxID=272635 RepID=Q98QN6_MYCPU|nr:nuclease-related domain-containing protein [Mycoplasmopsis pulmonis]MDZ7293284.1 NERD domain-containing protein [Mycoplasmopsis pulmonis]CAC13498.1 unknown; predicted coding region [Mycoplasmopsis pulmonis]VEU68089.1 Nuclease-related domain [Mycoplasmopsis pulmonis]
MPKLNQILNIASESISSFKLNTHYKIAIVLGMFFVFSVFVLFIIWKVKKLLKVKKLKKIGSNFEKKINSQLIEYVKSKYSFYHPSSMYEYSNKILFEVDGILLTSRALIVIEMKSITGSISGDAFDAFWTKRVGQNTYEIPNVIFQNKKHIDHILKIIGIKVPILSLIVFDSKIESIEISNVPAHALIEKENMLIGTLESLEDLLKVKITNDEIEHINNKLNEHKTSTSQNKKLHLSYARRNSPKKNR